ncbi:MAG: energy-coupling factor transporter transmembrane protein EcfT [Anaerolineales bacterium]|nr:energy-coupling factor transporter transmembrane protein EcfT [Anaerolineales bacterium]MCB0006954.1 energy-coupling factor transporter transmembrane protein EcfT [Anaerolineales bacterium]MCB0020404.1 energy-coupling factor transporter transmembrane protein EcfT [Anaerolineales bacterium]MCB0029641.1 energy-coupling factor transporter transmembrane protein EcfT [Anaerolineales bacterium]MCB8958716.1 energy-coupling factor transporter transmembrane protein EcfT [Ardenticatenales bacterium]
MQLVSDSPLRQYDPRLRLLLPLGASLLVMIPVARLALFFVLYGVLFQWARLAPIALRQLWRLKWWLLLIFVIDWLVVDLLLAVQVTLRVILLASAFIFMVYTTTPGELRLVLAWLRLPHRYAFSLSLAFQSVALFAQEWQLIQEAQRARGAWEPLTWRGWRALVPQVRQLVVLVVPAIVLTTKRAWTMTEAAHARGFDSPHRQPFYRLAMQPHDWVFLALLGALTILLLLVPIPFSFG